MLGLVVINSCSLPNAINDPVRVTDPIIDAKATEAIVKIAEFEPSPYISSYIDTIALAAPPKALNTATSWGIAVICTYLERVSPIIDPIIRPNIIHSMLVSVYFRTVTTIAISIAIDESLLPFLAVAGEASLFIPKMNKAADKR